MSQQTTIIKYDEIEWDIMDKNRRYFGLLTFDQLREMLKREPKIYKCCRQTTFSFEEKIPKCPQCRRNMTLYLQIKN